jgi:hypothetical protein
MMRQALITMVCCLICVVSVFAEVKVVHTTDGRVLRGEVTETTTGYEVATDMGSIALTREEVQRIDDAVEPAEAFQTQLAALEADDAAGHLELGKWAAENDLLDEAESMFNKVLELTPDDREAQLWLKQVVNRKERAAAAEDATNEDPDTTSPDVPTNGGDPVDPVEAPADWLLTMDDVYKIRMAEIRTSEDDLRIKIVDEDLVDAFRDDMEGLEIDGEEFDPDEFDDLSDQKKFLVMLDELGGSDTEYMPAFEIREDPEAFRTFRKNIWPVVSRSCGRSDCHGGAEGAGGLALVAVGADRNTDLSNRQYYTNFLVLDKTKKIINRDRPEDSLLLQYLLPPEMAKFKHPDVAGRAITAQFGSKRDASYELALDWITYGLEGPIHPRYNVSFTLPAARIAAAKALEEANTPEPTPEPEEPVDPSEPTEPVDTPDEATPEATPVEESLDAGDVTDSTDQ